MLSLDAATVLLQWACGGLAFLWFTTRRGEVGVGYGWLLRAIFGLLALLGVGLGFRYGVVAGRESAGIAVVVVAAAAMGVSVVRRRHTAGLDVVAAIVGVPGLVAAGVDAASGQGVGATAVSVARVVVGALFLGAVTDAMLLGHWYLVQPGLPRRHLNQLVGALGLVWPLEVMVMLLPTGMVSVFTGAVDDGWDGTLGWMWAACAIATIALVAVTRAALRERYYSAVMAATGLLYLAILTAFGTDLVARAVLAG